MSKYAMAVAAEEVDAAAIPALSFDRVDPRFDALRGNPRFHEIVNSVFPGS